MSTPDVTQGCPVSHQDGPRFLLHTAEFAADPHRIYREMRERHGTVVPVEIAPGVRATLIIGYRAAIDILHDPTRFPADPRIWQAGVPADCPVLPMMGWRPAARYNTGPDHIRYRQASRDAIDAVDTHVLHARVEKLAIPLINTFCETGAADLLSDYAFPLVFAVLNELIGCTTEIGRRVAAGMAARFDGGAQAGQGAATAQAGLTELIALKRVVPDDDITTRLTVHPAGLDDKEMVAQLMSLYGAGIEPQRNLIGNTLLLILTDERFGGDVLAGSLSTRDALEEVLFADPPIANFCTTYPRQAMLIDGTWVPGNEPVLISLAACNSDPDIVGGDRTGNRSHLAFSVGPHVCPGETIAYIIVKDAVDQLLDALPDIRLACAPDAVQWRPGPFHRAPKTLPVVFRPSQPFPITSPT
jgi:cytochrome P450